VLFSGGIDSTAALLSALDKGMRPLLLWVGFGQKNQDQEYQVVKEVSERIKQVLAVVCIDLAEYIEQGWKEWDYIIPARNFIFVSIAASVLGHSSAKVGCVFLAAHEEEIEESNTDKSVRFFRICSNLFSDYHQRDICVTTPFASVTKTDIISYWNRYWIDRYGISPHATITCYYGNNCGRCKACYKRNIALVAAGTTCDPDLKADVFLDEVGFIRDDFLRRIEHFPYKRKYEYLLALTRMKARLPREIRDYLDSLADAEIACVQDRANEISSVNILDSQWI
jgi:7-cyano-7-deazaguanine synthase in queuosine biosynthesis